MVAETDKTEDSQSNRTVVVAEDESLIRLDIVEALGDAGYDVVGEAASGQEALDFTRKMKPDVVVMDVKMPGMDGITAAKEIGKDNLAPVVMLTAFSQQKLVEKAAEAGAMAYVVKPFVPEKLLPALEVAITRFEQINTLRDEVSDLKARFEARKRVDRAKGLLMEKMGVTESEAFRWIQKTSMDRRLTMQEVADAVIAQVESDD
ncbi:ANTAR domain-containing response regulator [Bifidobacterium aquikefiri]|uniref:ANTAR domain-containing response regulator n=1 Tax=Bifidobacterium aquikefiri TaxID=1653207 RepID=UPI0039ECBEE6